MANPTSRRSTALASLEGESWEMFGQVGRVVFDAEGRDAERVVEVLKPRAIRYVNLKDLRDGPLEDGVRIGTIGRTKGMELRAVIIPRLGESRFPIDTEDRRSGQLGSPSVASSEPSPRSRVPFPVYDDGAFSLFRGRARPLTYLSIAEVASQPANDAGASNVRSSSHR